jgi:sigma-B regulation protein RsbU (phosphoserine phosphatase)
MSSNSDLITDFKTLNDIANALNQAADVHGALNDSLSRLVQIMKLDAGWIFVRNPVSTDLWWGPGYQLAAHYNLPPAMNLENPEAWKGGCDCQGFCNSGTLDEAYNEVRCSRLADLSGSRGGLRVHASAPLVSGDQVLGILNVAAANWDAFSPRALVLLTNIGAQMGAALERARLYDMLKERRIHEQAALLELSNQLLNMLELDDLVHYLVAEARRLLVADACALLLSDQNEKHLIFRASSGWLSDPVTEGRKVPADEQSRSGQVMLSQRPLTLNLDDGSAETSRWTAEWVEAEKFKAVAITPLIIQGRSIGTLVIQSRETRNFSEDEIRFLQLLANQAAIAIENTRLHQDDIVRQRMEKELAIGRQIQLSLLPKSCPSVEGWLFCDAYKPAREVGGDFYDFFEIPDKPGSIGLVIADVADKGVPAALFMGVSRTLIRSAALSGKDPASTLQSANKLILAESESGLFLSAFYGILDTISGQLRFANAGHNPPLWYSASEGQITRLSAKGIVLCVLDEISLEERHIKINFDDVIVFYTDGVTEAFNVDYEEFGEERLRDVIARFANCSAAEILKAIVDAVEDFSGEQDQTDDLTLFVVKRMSLATA